MTISSDTWAIVVATGLGPIAAVAITLWRESYREKRARRLHVFRTLMATRRLGISADHVNALNLVEVDFYGKRRVQDAWAVYLKHLNSDQSNMPQWIEDKERLLANLLSEEARVLGLDVPAMNIFKGGYAPTGWQERDTLVLTAMQYVKDLHDGTRGVKVMIVEPPPGKVSHNSE